MRKLVTLRHISEIKPIQNADAIELAVVDGWNCVVKRGEFNPGDWVVYFEIDSILPYGDERFAFLMARGCKMQPTDDGGLLEGHRLRTIKLRGQVSQGLVLAVPSTWKIEGDIVWVEEDLSSVFGVEEDLSSVFGVKKYEKPVPAQLAGLIAGNYPFWLPKTDQERVQNCYRDIPDTTFIVEEKYEGSSMTVYWDGLAVGVTSRNLNLKLEQEGNTFVDLAKSSGLLSALEKYAISRDLKDRVAIRGELIGPRIQDNIYNLSSFKFMLYDIWVNDRYLTSDERLLFCLEHLALNVDKEIVLPVKSISRINPKSEGMTVEDLVTMANGTSNLYPTKREGLVFKSEGLVNGRVFSFKVISPEYLLSERE